MALTDLDSIAKRHILMEAGGMLIRTGRINVGSTTAANTTSGLISAKRFPCNVTLPSVTGYTGYELDAELFSSTASTLVAAIEYDLGVLTISGNSFAAGNDASMPTKDTRIEGTSYSARQTGSCLPMLVATAALTATTPTITTTYVNEDGTGSRTSSMTLPSSPAVDTAFFMIPHLNSGDTGMQDVTNMSTSAGSAGTLRVKGLIPFAVFNATSASSVRGAPFIQTPNAPIIGVSGDDIAFYLFGNSGTTAELIFSVFGRPI